MSRREVGVLRSRFARRLGRPRILIAAGALWGGLNSPTTLGQNQNVPKYTGSCADAGCHDRFARQKTVHAPVTMGSCDACHEESAAAAHQFRLTRDGVALCTDCHDAFEGKIVHGPVQDGCLTCHDPHGSQTAKLLTKGSVAELCTDCHDDLTEGLSELHGPVAVGECLACHAPHASELQGLLSVAQPKLCLECHEETAEALEAGKHVHPPVREACTTCHRPHAADQKHLLTLAADKLCADCHDDIQEKASDSAVKHSPVTSASACLTCHDAHVSEEDALLIAQVRTLCLSCHNRAMVIGERKLLNMAERLSATTHLHGPLQEGGCSACHDPHGSSRGALLGKAFPVSLYVPYAEQEFALCFDCHDAAAFAEPTTDEDTEFRNGSQNLHHLHVHRHKGRSCRACHDPHGAMNDKQIAESVPFGRWNIPIRFRASPTGGSCAPGCHRPYRYDRDQPVANLRP